MSIDWNRRQGTLGKHRHLAADVLDEETGTGAVGEPAAIHYSEADPGAVGAGAIWIKPTNDLDVDADPAMFIRSAADDGWLTASLVHTDPISGDRYAVIFDDGHIYIYVVDSESVVLNRTTITEGATELSLFDATGVKRSQIAINAAGIVAIGTWDAAGDDGGGMGIEEGVITIRSPGYATYFELSSTNIKAVGLPTADPVAAGALWNDAGTLKVSAGA